jgi:hypothetical protein
MGSIMRCCGAKMQVDRGAGGHMSLRWRHSRVALGLVFLLLGTLAVTPAQAFVISSADHRWQSDAFLLVRLGVELDLPDILLEAIANGIAVYLISEVRLERGRLFRTNEVEARSTRRFRLAYSALSRHYILTDLDREMVVLAPTLGDALDAAASRLGRVLLEAERVGVENERRTLSARVLLDHTALPLPLQWDPRMRRTNLAGGGWLRWPLR